MYKNMRKRSLVFNFKLTEIKEDKILAIAMCFLIAFSPLQLAFLFSIREIITIPYKLDVLVILIPTYFIYGLSAIVVIKRFKFDMFLIYAIFLYLWWISNSHLKMNSVYFFQLGDILFLSSLPWYLIARSIKDYKIVLRYFQKVSFPISISCIILYVFFIRTGIYNLDYMSFSYMLLPAAVISTYVFIKEYNIFHALNVLACVIVIFIGGARGPLLCLFSFIVVFLLINITKFKTRIAIMISSLVALMSILIANSQNILLYTVGIFRQLGIESRSLSLLIAGNISSDNGRNQIQEYCQNLINQNLSGVGFGVDRYYLYNFIGDIWSVDGINKATIFNSYPHSFYYEILLQFGVYIGSGMLAAFFIILLLALFGKADIEIKYLICIFIPLGIVKLFISSSYIYDSSFFVLFGLLINSLRFNGRKTAISNKKLQK